MTTTKQWYLSRTIWASAVTIAVSVGGLVGLPVANIDGGALTDGLLQALTAVSGLIALFGRVSATSRISKSG
jgi:hypothetical protein